MPTLRPAIESIYSTMLLWIILGVGWVVILLAAMSLFRIASYADKQMRRIAQRPRSGEDQAA